jgi:hypothetical protein
LVFFFSDNLGQTIAYLPILNVVKKKKTKLYNSGACSVQYVSGHKEAYRIFIKIKIIDFKLVIS